MSVPEFTQVEQVQEVLLSACNAVVAAVSKHGLGDADAVALPLANLASVLAVVVGYEGDETLPEALSLLSETHDLLSLKPKAPRALDLRARVEGFLTKTGVLEPEAEEVES